MLQRYSIKCYFFSIEIMKNRISVLRDRLGLTQEQLGETFGVSKSSVAQWEAGKTNLPTSRLLELAALFKVSVDYLLGLTNVDDQASAQVININETEKKNQVMKVHSDYMDRELEFLKQVNEKLEKHNEDQALLIDLLMGRREDVTRKVPKKVRDKLMNSNRTA